MKRKITVYDIAKEANVSPSTVSRIITGNAKVNAEKREKVEGIIKKYDFHPNILARSLLKNESKTIGFILPDITNPFFSTVFFETEKNALTEGYTIILANSMGNYKVESTLLNMFMEKQVDAIVFMGGRVNNVRNHPKLTAEMRQIAQTTPIVMVNGKMPGIDCYNIKTSEDEGLTELMEYLISLGHTKFGILGGKSSITSSYQKRSVFRKVLKKHDLLCNEDWIIESEFSMSGGIEATNRLMELKERPTAIIGINDYVAIGIMQALQSLHVKVPDDISVTGFDGSYLSVVTNPALTTVSQNFEGLGKTVVNTILDILSGKTTEKNKIVDTKLIVRDSCGQI